MQSPERRGPWLVVTVVCVLIALVAAIALVVLVVSEGVPEDVPLVGEDNDGDFERPEVEYVNVEDGDIVTPGQSIEVLASHARGVQSVRFAVSGSPDVLTATGGGNDAISVQFPFTIEEPGAYTLDVQAEAIDGTLSEPLLIEVIVE